MMNKQMVQVIDNTKTNRMYIAFELSNLKWKLMFSNGIKRRIKTIEARDLLAFEHELLKAKSTLKIDKEDHVYSCYEAGRDGFWIHRYLESVGIKNIVIDPASIEVNQKKRRAKTDRLDVRRLMDKLILHHTQNGANWSVVRIPSIEQEDARRIDREITRLKKERAAHSNRIKSLLILHGIRMGIKKTFNKDLEQIRI